MKKGLGRTDEFWFLVRIPCLRCFPWLNLWNLLLLLRARLDRIATHLDIVFLRGSGIASASGDHLLQLFLHRHYSLGMRGSEVVCFSEVFRQIVELDGVVSFALCPAAGAGGEDQFPRAVAEAGDAPDLGADRVLSDGFVGAL